MKQVQLSLHDTRQAMQIFKSDRTQAKLKQSDQTKQTAA
jgi:hypothetical protein